MTVMLDGPRVGAAKPTFLVVLLHGYGADGNDLIALGQQWTTLLPGAAFVAPHAPERCGQSPSGKQWFALSTRDAAEQWNGVNKAQPALDAFLDAELARLGLDDRRLALVGFSQGTMMALHVGLRRRQTIAALVGFSGILAGPDQLAARSPASPPPPLLLTHGSEDDVIPVEAMFMSLEALAAAAIPCQWHLSFGVAHGIDEGALGHAGQLLIQSSKTFIKHH